MTRLALALLALVCVTAAHAQSLVTVKPEPKNDAWWLRADFHALHTDIRGIPVKSIRTDWCKASEFSRDLFPKNLLVEDGKDVLKPYGLDFSFNGNFDGSGAKLTALVGTYETCAAKKGRFFLILDTAARKVRYLDAEIAKDRFSVLAVDKGKIIILYCLECDITAAVQWSRAKKRFVMSLPKDD